MNGRALVLFAAVFTMCLSAGTVSVATAQEIVQTTCPVMVGNKIDPNIFTEYEGKKVYFCCMKCKAAFEASPEKYLGLLPQFASTEAGSAERSGFNPGQYIEAFGLATLSLLIVTFLCGFFMKKNPKLLHPWHKRLAYVTIIVALCHATLVMLAHNL